MFNKHQSQKLGMELVVLMQLSVRIMITQCSIERIFLNLYRIIHAHIISIFSKKVYSAVKPLVHRKE